MPHEHQTTDLAKVNWDTDREKLNAEAPEWEMPAWSRAPAWRRRPYILAAKEGKHPDALKLLCASQQRRQADAIERHDALIGRARNLKKKIKALS